MIQINENTRITADDNGYAVQFRREIAEDRKGKIIKHFGKIGEYTWTPRKYASFFSGILQICIEDAIRQKAASKDIYDLEDITKVISNVKKEINEKLKM